MKLEIIPCDVPTGLSGCLHKYMYIKFNGSKMTKCLKIPVISSIYAITYMYMYVNKWQEKLHVQSTTCEILFEK